MEGFKIRNKHTSTQWPNKIKEMKYYDKYKGCYNDYV